MANLSQAEEAVRHGASFITHLFNAMPAVSSSSTCCGLCSLPHLAGGRQGAMWLHHNFFCVLTQFHHRDPGIVGLLTSDQVPAGQTVYYGMIADGIHTNPAALRIAHRSHPSGGCSRSSSSRKTARPSCCCCCCCCQGWCW